VDERTTIQVSAELRKELKRIAARRDRNYQELLEDMIGLFTELDKGKTVISIPVALAEKLDSQVAKGNFKNRSEYVTYLLRIILYEEQRNTRIPEERIRKRLKALGYTE